MGHIVVFEGSERVPTFHRCEELADAVSFVEKLRNDRGVDKVQIYRTEEIRFDFKPYYRVELGALGAGTQPTPIGPAPAPSMTPPPPISAIPTPQETATPLGSSQPEPAHYVEDDDDLSVGSGVRRGLFGR